MTRVRRRAILAWWREQLPETLVVRGVTFQRRHLPPPSRGVMYICPNFCPTGPLPGLYVSMTIDLVKNPDVVALKLEEARLTLECLIDQHDAEQGEAGCRR